MIKRFKQMWTFALGVGVLGLILGVGAQNFAQPGVPPGGETQCSALLQAALESTDTQCSDTSRNQACYGHVLNLVSPRPDLIESLVFESRGDKVNLQDVESMELSPLDLLEEHWGVVLMQVQANLPDSLPGQNVTFILFGDVQIENAVGTPVEIAAELLAPSNIRIAPGETRPVLASLSAGSTIITNGKAMTADGELWVRVNHDPDEEVYGWILGSLVDVAFEELPDVQASDQAINPMQAFYFKTGLGAPQCVEAPVDGMLIQTPNGAGKVDFKVNGMEIALGSTAYLTAPEGEDQSCVYLIEGESDVAAAGDGVTVAAGERTCVPLDENGIASGAPSEPEPYDAEFVNAVVTVLNLLPEDVELPEARPTRSPTSIPSRTPTPMIRPNTAVPTTQVPTSTPTDVIFPTNVPPTAIPSQTPLPPCEVDESSIPCLPVSSFTFTVSDRTVVFSNNSIGDVTSARWNFGDGNTSTDYSPTHTFATYGSYSVRLRVDNAHGFDRVTVTVHVLQPSITPTFIPTLVPTLVPTMMPTITPTIILTPPTALFNYTLDGFHFSYQDTSTAGSATITAWAWDFGDGLGTSGQTGLHTFAAGTYTVTLTITDANGLSDSESVTVNFGACSYSTSNSVQFAVSRDGSDMSSTVYNIYFKNTDCSIPGTPIGMLSVSNPGFTASIYTGQHYFVQQTVPCVTTSADGMAGTMMVDIMVSGACP